MEAVNNMLKLREVIVTPAQGGNPAIVSEFQKSWYTHAVGDTTKAVDVTSKGNKVDTVQRPDGNSKQNADVLLADAIADMQAEFPKSDPVIKVLEFLTKGKDLLDRASARPKSAEDLAKETEKLAKLLVAKGKFATIAEAVVFLG
jgi:hypothetical protein